MPDRAQTAQQLDATARRAYDAWVAEQAPGKRIPSFEDWRAFLPQTHGGGFDAATAAAYQSYLSQLSPEELAQGWGTPNSFLQKSALGDPRAPAPVAQAGAPGAELDTAQPDDAAARLQPLIAQLQQQALTGGGAWEGALADTTRKAQANATALSQTPGVGVGQGRYAAAQARGAAGQRAVGQGNIMRAQSQTDAQGQLADIYGGMAGMDAQQAEAQAAARAGQRQADILQQQQATQTAGNVISGLGQTYAGLAGGMSDGGPVPGQAPVFGDDEANDTVPAMLSPGEVVIPRSVALKPNAPDAAADFVRAAQAKSGNAHHFDSGGTVPWRPGDADPTARTGTDAMGGLLGGTTQAPSVGNGALLDTSRYDASRQSLFDIINGIGARAAGGGPSAAPQMSQNASDAALTEAMQAQAASPRAAAPVIGAAAQRTQQAGGEAVARRATEQSSAGLQVARGLMQQRERDLAIAQAKQQAAWRNTMANKGIGAAQQAALRSILGGFGQMATSVSGALGKGMSPSGGGYDYDNPTTVAKLREGDGDDDFAPYPGDTFTPSVYGGGNPFGEQSPESDAHGGVVGRDEDFVRALRRRAA